MITLPWRTNQDRIHAAEFCAALDNEGKRFNASIDCDGNMVIKFV